MDADTLERESIEKYENANAIDIRGANASQTNIGRTEFSAEIKYAKERIANSATGVFDGISTNKRGYHTANTIAADNNESKPATLLGVCQNFITT
ncbi:MAG: hypothetical protein WAO71_06595 [Gallionella sp.]